MKLLLLKKEKDFEKNRYRKTATTQSLRIRVAQAHQNSPRFGFIIPKKVLSKATDRNLVKRRIKNVLRNNLSSIKPADVIVFPQARSLKLNPKMLENEILTSLKRAGLWKS